MAAQMDTSTDTGGEEGYAAYRPRGFHPVYIGDIFLGRYSVLRKIGYGQYPTVWLAHDTQRNQGEEHEYIALKILSAECYSTGHDIFEREILIHLRAGNFKLAGYRHVCHLLDEFEHHGPNGNHVCLVFPLIGETLRSFSAWFPDSMVPYSVMRRFTIQLALALDYAHEEGVIHTDIQPSNIFVKFRDSTRISLFLKECQPPAQDRTEDRYTPVESQSLRWHYFTKEDGENVSEFDIVLGDWGVASWKNKHLTENIQPVALRAPEVLIKAPWDASTDWWNLGAVILEVYRAVRMFSGYVAEADTTNGEPFHYELRQHLAEIVDFFGPFPRSLLDQGDEHIVKDCFSDDGTVRGYPQNLNRPRLNSPEILLGLEEADREEFASFLRHVMKVDPTERPDAIGVLKHPWLDAWRGE